MGGGGGWHFWNLRRASQEYKDDTHPLSQRQVQAPDCFDWQKNQCQVKHKVDDFSKEQAELCIKTFAFNGGIYNRRDRAALKCNGEDDDDKPDYGERSDSPEGPSEPAFHTEQAIVQEND